MKNKNESVVLSMTTIPCRKIRFMENLLSILNQTYKFDRFVIVLQDNFSEEDINFFENIAEFDSRIELLIGEEKWRSCNKLLPTLKKYPNDVIITLDDDIYYPPKSIELLVEAHKKNPDCVITHQAACIGVDEGMKRIILGRVSYINARLGQKSFDRYLSNCCLFPVGAFKNTDLYDYSKMMKCVNGTHDEWWFWVNTTMNGIQTICVDYVKSMCSERKSEFKCGEPQLCIINNEDTCKRYNDEISKMYFDRLWKEIQKKPTVFTVKKEDEERFARIFPNLKKFYSYGDIEVTHEETGKKETLKAEKTFCHPDNTNNDSEGHKIRESTTNVQM